MGDFTWRKTELEHSQVPIAGSNGLRLSCGAERYRSHTEDYLRERGAVSCRRVVGRR